MGVFIYFLGNLRKVLTISYFYFLNKTHLLIYKKFCIQFHHIFIFHKFQNVYKGTSDKIMLELEA